MCKNFQSGETLNFFSRTFYGTHVTIPVVCRSQLRTTQTATTSEADNRTQELPIWLARRSLPIESRAQDKSANRLHGVGRNSGARRRFSTGACRLNYFSHTCTPMWKSMFTMARRG